MAQDPKILQIGVLGVYRVWLHRALDQGSRSEQAPENMAEAFWHQGPDHQMIEPMFYRLSWRILEIYLLEILLEKIQGKFFVGSWD